MAIANMKKLTLFGMLSEKETILKKLQRLGCVEILSFDENFEVSPSDGKLKTDKDIISKLRWTIEFLSKYSEKKSSFFEQKMLVNDNELNAVLRSEEKLFDEISDIEKLIANLNSLKNKQNSLKITYSQMLPWKNFDLSRDDMNSLNCIKQFTGSIANKQYNDFISKSSSLNVYIEEVSTNSRDIFFHALCHIEDVNAFKTILTEFNYTNETFSGLNGTSPFNFFLNYDKEISKLDTEIRTVEDKFKQYSRIIDNLKALHDIYELKEKRNDIEQYFNKTEQTFKLQGWVPEKCTLKLEDSIRKLSPSAVLFFEEPGENEEPSVLFENKKLISPFESIIEGYSLPKYGSIDPTLVMTPFYISLFGIMLSDAGYGLLMTILLFLIIKIKKIPVKNGKMLYVLMFGGIGTVVWGLVFNTALGFSPLPKISNYFPLDPVNNPMPVMILCLIVGALHLLAGILIAAYANIRKKDIISLISDQLSWLMLLSGLGMLIVPQYKTTGQIVALLGAGIILFMAGRHNKNPFKRLISGLGALYGITGWISDLLSYMRLFGMGLATGVIGMVFNTLIGMLWSGSFIGKIIGAVLFIFCHLFNLGINALGAYVHSCRLQYIEFFSKFYEEGGRAFKPLNTSTKYVNIQ